jgi:hypothetical protein
MAKSQKQPLGVEDEFPVNVPWAELWQLANEIKDDEAKQIFCEAIWCLRAGGFHAAAVLSWVAISAYMRKVAERLPAVTRNVYLPLSSTSKDGKRFLDMCRELTLFGMTVQTTAPIYTRLDNLLELRDRSAHTPVKDIGRSQREKMISDLKICVETILIHSTETFTFGDGVSVVLNLAKHPKTERAFDLNEAEQIITFVTAAQMPTLANKLLNTYLTYDLSPDLNSQNMPDEVEDVTNNNQPTTQAVKPEIAYANLARLWNRAYRKLERLDSIMLLNILKDEFADAIYRYAEELNDSFSLLEIGEGERRARGRRKLSELADLEVWQKDASPEKYRRLFYACFAESPGELFSLDSGIKRSLIEHAPEEHKQTLQQAFQETFYEHNP